MLLFKRISLLACFCLLAGFSMAQTKPFVGQVLDSLSRPIAYANVVAINQSTQKIAGFGISNNEGKFKVTLLEGPSYLIRVSFVGYRQFEQALSTWDSDTPQLVILKQSDTQLGLVEVVSEMPVTMKGGHQELARQCSGPCAGVEKLQRGWPHARPRYQRELGTKHSTEGR
ncbi:MAG: carboxypeptidase-like regulatory domain-containing protein [Algoriphagus sp.]|nr:carboxypeptidase-like regulatory domain-containing protein [Algoriphagus sp.]